MSLLTPNWAPNIHPIIVHFPIALLSAGFAADLVSLIVPRRPAVRDTATWLYCGGAATAIIAYFTGEIGADAMLLPAQVTPFVSEHPDWAFRTTWFFVFFASGRLAISYIIPFTAVVRATAFVAALAGIGMLVETAEHGGMLVFQHGVGVHSITTDRTADALAAEVGATQIDSGIINLQDGSWVWRPVQGADTVLTEQFKWLKNDSTHMSPKMVDDREKGTVLALRPHGIPVLFVAGQDLHSAQADVYVNIDQFDGELQLVLHVQDEHTFDFLSVGDAAVKLGRMEEGVPTVFEEKPLSQSGWLFLRMFGGDGHFRGYVNGELLTHGHADDLPSGPFGFLVNGTGTILIDQIQVQAVP